MKIKVYIESTVVSYFSSPKLSKDLIVAANKQITYEWWNDVLPKLQPYISPVVIEEISRGDKGAAKLRLEAIKGFTVLEVNEEIKKLADLFMKKTKIPEKARPDSYHFAIAAWHGINFLATWNFEHLASGRIKSIIEQTCHEIGVVPPIICTPQELMEY